MSPENLREPCYHSQPMFYSANVSRKTNSEILIYNFFFKEKWGEIQTFRSLLLERVVLELLVLLFIDSRF